MNKILRYSFVALMAIIAVYAKASVSTLNFTAACGGTGTASDGAVWTVTSDGDESNFDNNKGIHYGTSKKAVQYIKLSTDKINGTITKIVVNASTANSVTATADVTVDGAAFGGDAQTISSTATDYTFTGSASGAILVTITKPSSANGALYVKSIEVTYTPAAGSVSKPEFSVASGMFFEAQSVALTCETEGAKILYTLDGSDPAYTDAENYTGVFYDGNALTISKTTTIKAMAVKDGNKSDIVSAAYTIIITEAKGTAESPFSVADGLTVVNALDDNATSPKIFIKGYVVGNITVSSGQASFKIADAADATENLITVYKAKGLKNDNFAEGDAKAGDVVVINAPLQKYVKTEGEGDDAVTTITPETQFGYIYSINGKTEFDPVVFEGDGTAEKPYTIADLLQMRASIYPTDTVWVKGIIVGAIKDNKLVTTEISTASNIAIAATAEETEFANIVPVELKADTDFRTNLNLVGNPLNMGKELLIKGKIKAYFNVTGVKDLEAYQLEEDPELPVVEAQPVYKFTATNQWASFTFNKANFKAASYKGFRIEYSNMSGIDQNGGTEGARFNILVNSAETHLGKDWAGNDAQVPNKTAYKNVGFDADHTVFTGDFAEFVVTDDATTTCPTIGQFALQACANGNSVIIKKVVFIKADDTEVLPEYKDGTSVWGYTIEEVADGITNINAAKAENAVRYNLAGQKVNDDYKGVVIMNGKKMLNK